MTSTSILFGLILAIAIFTVDAKGSARLRGKYFDDLEQFVRNPTIDENIRGKTLKELGVQQQENQRLNDQVDQYRRQMQGQLTMNFFSIYDEFGPNFSNMGDTAGFRGIVYNTAAKDNGLEAEFVDGALQGTCSIISSDGKQLCNYEVFILNSSSDSIGTIVATGTVSMELDTTNLLIIEATGDDFVGYRGGMITITYTAIGTQTVMDLGITFRR